MTDDRWAVETNSSWSWCARTPACRVATCRAYASDEAAEEDLYQDILLELWRSLPSFEGRSSRDTWLYRVALNTALQDRRGRETRRAARLDEDDPVRGSRDPATGPAN